MDLSVTAGWQLIAEGNLPSTYFNHLEDTSPSRTLSQRLQELWKVNTLVLLSKC